MTADYAKLYEDHAAAAGDPTASIGDGDFDLVGRTELAVLRLEGLRPEDSLLDFGCGVGRLALHAIPYLARGRYLGLDIAPTMIKGARQLVRDRLPGVPKDRYRFEVNDGEDFAIERATFDMICAFSVFTHMEAEDTYRYMCRLATLLPAGNKLVSSVLTLETGLGRQVFMREAALAPTDRWQRVRNVATTYTLTERLAAMAGFRNFRWYRGDEYGIRLDDGTSTATGQSVLVAERG